MASAWCFCPWIARSACSAKAVLEKIAREHGLTVLGWRDTPINGDAIGRLARSSQPYIEQVFIRRSRGMDQDTLERRLYAVRKRAETAVMESKLEEKDSFYVVSLSSRTIVYKGLLLLAPQISQFLQGNCPIPEVMSALSARCTSDFRQTRSPAGSWPIPIDTSRTTAKSTRFAATRTGCTRRQSVLSSPLFGKDIEKAAARDCARRQRFVHAR